MLKQLPMQAQKNLTVAKLATPKPLEELSEHEIQRRRCIARLMTHTLKQLTKIFTDSGFDWLLPVIFSQSTDPLWPDPCASIEKRLEVEIYGKIVRTTTSMIVHKMVACSLASPKLFILSPNVRIEKAERAATGLHTYEFTQLDFEVRCAASDDIKGFVEHIIQRLIESLKIRMKCELAYLGRYESLRMPRSPFRVYDKTELEKEYGRDWESRIILENAEPLWVTNIPREFYDFEDFESGQWDNYDLYLPTCGEVLSGSRREFEYCKMVSKMEREKVKKENYDLILKLARDGKIKPSAGAGIGVERLVSWIAGSKHVGEAQLFPKIPGIVYDL